MHKSFFLGGRATNQLSTTGACFCSQKFIYLHLFLAVLGLCCCEDCGLLSSCTDAGFSLQWLLLLQSTGSRAQGLQSLCHVASAVVAPGL